MSRIYLRWQGPQTLETVEKALSQGRLVVGDSDTVLGLLAPLTQAGFDALNRIKKREGKPYLVLFGDRDQVKTYCQPPFSAALERLMAQCWPGPLTLILPAKAGISPFMAPEGAIAVRIPHHEGLLALLERVGGLFSTSANLAGQPVPEKVEDIDEAIVQQVACIVTDGAASSTPSTILDCTKEHINVVREGAYPIADLERICGQKFVT